MRDPLFRSPPGTVLLLALLLMLITTAATGQQNPFLSGSSADSPSSETSARSIRLGPGQGSPGRLISSIQRDLYSLLAGAMGKIKSPESSPRFLLILLMGACAYGMLHALGPGHRKTVIFSYFLAEDAKLLRGILAGVAMALLHGAAAVGIILPVYYLVRGSLLVTFNSVSRSIEIGTFLFIALFGAVMFLLHLIPHLKKGRNDVVKSPLRPHGLLLLILGSGLVPCPGAAMILLFALSQDMVTTGLLAVGAMSVGMAITLSLVAVLSLGARGGLERSVRRNRRAVEIVHTVLELGGYGLIMVFGTMMVFALL